MASCEHILQQVWNYLDEEITPENLTAFKQHIEMCRGCFSKVDFHRLLRKKMRERTSHQCPEDLKLRIHKIIDLF